jgi:hypothetical protein
MSYIEESCDKDIFLEHNGVTIYHAYKNDDYSQPYTQWYSLGPQDDAEEFDVRELPGYDPAANDSDHPRVIRLAIEAGLLKQEVEA